MNRSNLNASTKSRVLLRINTIIAKLTMKDAKKLTVYFSICWLNICYFQSRIIQLILDNYSGRSGLAPFKSICDYRNIQKDWLPAQKKKRITWADQRKKLGLRIITKESVEYTRLRLFWLRCSRRILFWNQAAAGLFQVQQNQ